MKVSCVSLLLIFMLQHGSHGIISPHSQSTVRSVFGNLSVGDSSYYIAFRAENYSDPKNLEFRYLEDTLAVEVRSRGQKGFLICERYTDGSSIMRRIQSGETDTSKYMPHTASKFYAKYVDDVLFFSSFSDSALTNSLLVGSLFPNFAIKLPLADITTEKVSIRGWKTSFPYCECYNEGYATDFELLGNWYERLNVIVDDRGMVLDGVGQTWIYSREAGVVRAYYTSGMVQTSCGWDLLR